jgi:predicted enzyme related to lactoylglutathione lyase
MATLAQELDADLSDAIAFYEQSFKWLGRTISCVINFRMSKLIALKSSFGAAGQRVYPKCGQTIIIGSAKYQIVRKGNAAIKAVSGGFIEDPAFIDDPTDPSIDIEFAHFVRK